MFAQRNINYQFHLVIPSHVGIRAKINNTTTIIIKEIIIIQFSHLPTPVIAVVPAQLHPAVTQHSVTLSVIICSILI